MDIAFRGMSLSISDSLIAKIVALSAPVIIGTAMTLTAEAFRPGESMPLETVADQFFVGLFVIGAPLAMIGLVCVPIAVVLLAAYVWRHGVRPMSMVLSGLVLLAIIASIRTFNDVSQAVENYGR